MSYAVVYTDEFVANLDAHLDYLFEQGVTKAVVDRWYGKLFELIDSLDE